MPALAYSVSLKSIEAIFGARGFTPSALFSSGEQGAWYDPSDFSTMFQDSAGTTPVTAVEQPVGLLLDKSKGLALGAELVTNGDFSGGTTGWTASNVTPSVSGGELTLTNIGAVYGTFGQSFTTVTGRWYKATVDVRVGTAANAFFSARTSLSGGTIASTFTSSSTTVRLTIHFTATGTTTWIVLINDLQNNATAFYDNISVRELPGNHASQSTAASRPVLSARVNQLTYTEQFDNAVWSKTNLNTTGTPAWVNAATSPDGTASAEKLIPNTSVVQHLAKVTSLGGAGQYTASMYFKSGGYNTAQIYIYQGAYLGTATARLDLGTVVVAGSGSPSGTITPVGDGWYRVTLTVTATGSFEAGCFIGTDGSVAAFAGDGTSGIYIWGADLRATNDGVGLPAYQRVTTSTDYDISGFPLYLKFDGVDDSLATGTIDFTAANKMSVFAGVRKLTNTYYMIVELGPNSSSNNGSFSLYTYFPGEVYWSSLGTVFTQVNNTVSSAPRSMVLTGTSNIAAPIVQIRTNGTQEGSNTASQGTGNYGNYPLNIGRRNNTSLPYNGNLYSLIVRGALSTDAQIASTETYVNNLTKAY